MWFGYLFPSCWMCEQFLEQNKRINVSIFLERGLDSGYIFTYPSKELVEYIKIYVISGENSGQNLAGSRFFLFG